MQLLLGHAGEKTYPSDKEDQQMLLALKILLKAPDDDQGKAQVAAMMREVGAIRPSERVELGVDLELAEHRWIA